MAETNKHQRIFSPQQLAIGIAIGMGVLLYSAWSFMANCILSGQEFSPQLFQERSFSYYRVPGTRIRLSKTSITPAVSPNSKHILGTIAIASPTITWHVVEASQGQRTENYGPGILLHYLRAKNANGQSYWDEWSFRNPTMAKFLWPTVQQAALQDLYFCIPDLMRRAESESDANKLKKQLTLICLQAAIQRANAPFSVNSPPANSSARKWANIFAADYLDDNEVKSIIEQFP